MFILSRKLFSNYEASPLTDLQRYSFGFKPFLD